MIGVIASILAGFITGTYITVLSAVPYVIALKNRDMGLVAYFLYVVYLGSVITISTVYSYHELVVMLVLSLASLLLLDDILRASLSFGRLEAFTVVFILIGLVVPEAFITALTFYFIVKFKPGVLVAVFSISVAAVFIMLRSILNVPGSAANQALVMSAFGIFLAVSSAFWKNLKKRGMFN